MTRRLTRRKLLAIETALEVCERLGSRNFRAVAESLPEPSPARLRDVHDALEWTREVRDVREEEANFRGLAATRPGMTSA
jgi:hypothetical protein